MHFSERKELTIEDIRHLAPSAFAEAPHSSRSERYVYMPTHKVLEALYDTGFRAFQATQALCRVPGKAEFTKHLIRLRHPELEPINGIIPEVAFLNSHDGSSAYKLKLGMYRMVCMNGCITGTDFAGVSVYHTGRQREEVVEGAFTVVQQAPKLTQTLALMKGTHISEREGEILAGQALMYQYGEDTPIEPWQLLEARRVEDKSEDLLTRYQVVQENLMKGGVKYRNTTTNRRNTTRAIRGIDGDLRLNSALFDLTTQMLALKTGGLGDTASDLI